jgi:hypothetical protein
MMAAMMAAKASVLLVVLVLALVLLAVTLIAALASRRPASGHSGSRAAWVFASIFIFCVLLLVGFFAWFTVRVESPRRSLTATIEPQGAPVLEVGDLETGDLGSGDFEQWQKANALAPPATGKPWLSDAPGSQGQIVGYSGLEPEDGSKPGAREAARAAAMQAAERSAMGHLEALLLQGIKGKHDIASSVSLEELKSLAVAEIRRALPPLIADRFEQEVPGKSANLKYHRAAVLVKADPKALDSMTHELADRLQQHAREAEAHRSTVITTVASALGLAFVVFLLYSFLNAGTKGHFAWPLRIISVATLLAVYLGLMYLKGWLPR